MCENGLTNEKSMEGEGSGCQSNYLPSRHHPFLLPSLRHHFFRPSTSVPTVAFLSSQFAITDLFYCISYHLHRQRFTPYPCLLNFPSYSISLHYHPTLQLTHCSFFTSSSPILPSPVPSQPLSLHLSYLQHVPFCHSSFSLNSAPHTSNPPLNIFVLLLYSRPLCIFTFSSVFRSSLSLFYSPLHPLLSSLPHI